MNQCLKYFLAVYISLSTFTALADEGVRLPLHSLRDQGETSHCWAYSMSNLLESRALLRDHIDAIIDVEKDVKYWIDFERLLYVFKSKKDFYLGHYEGAWQIEFWETLLKHGKQIYQSREAEPTVLYPLFELFDKHLQFMGAPRPAPDPELLPPEEAKDKLRAMTDEKEALTFITDYLDRWYGKPLNETTWFNNTVKTAEIAELLMGGDFKNDHDIESVVLVKPVEDGNFGWARYLNERYWGYRFNKEKIFGLIELSLKRQWPVTFDDVGHAMTIVGFEPKDKTVYYAIADSLPGVIRWMSREDLSSELNLLTFFKEAVKGEIPDRTKTSLLVRVNASESLDKIDHTDIPPR